MSFTRKCQLGLVVSCLLLAVAGPAHGQPDAEKALDAARVAFDNGQFDQARDLLITAAQTDAKNPDIRLLLGKAHYELGEVGEAMAAWRATLQLAPQQAYAKRMLEVLTGQSLDIDTRLKIVASLLQDRIFDPVPGELAKVRSQTLSDSQRLLLLQLETEYHLGVDKPQFALRTLGELAVRFPDEQELPRTQFLLARARVAAGGESLASGLTLLQKLATDQAESPLGPAAELELIAFRLRQRTAEVDALLAWIEKHAGHAQQTRARDELVLAIRQLLSDTAQGPTPKPEDALSDGDQKALSAAATAYAAMTTAVDADALTVFIIQHIEKRYAACQAFDAASSGLEALEKIQMLPSSARLVVAARKRLDVQVATAEYNEIVARLAQNLDDTAALKAWIESHPDHPQFAAARQALLNWYLAATLRLKAPTKDSPLATTDVAAIEVAAEIFAETENVATELKLTERLAAHIQKRYVAAAALSAAREAYEKLLAIELPVTSRARALHGLAAVQARIALTKLVADATEQRIVAGPLPDDLKAVLATYQQINALVPASQTWNLQATLAGQVAALSERLAWPARPAAPKPTQAWAFEIALPVIADGSDAEAVKAASATVDGIINELAALPQPTADGLAVSIHEKLLAVLPEGEDTWVAAMLRRADLLTVLVNRVFNRNAEAGLRDANGQLSEPQTQLIETLKTLVTARPSQAGAAVGKLQAAIVQHLATSRFDVAEAAYAALKDGLPPRQQFDVELAMISLSVQQITGRDARALAKGFQVEAVLDPLLAKALLRVYELQRGIAEADSRLASLRTIGDSVVAHYRGLEMFEVAEEAIGVKAEDAVPTADKYAQFQRAGLKFHLANRELSRLLQTFRGREKIAFTPAFETAQTAFEKFITKYSSDPLARQAVEQLFGIGQLFDSHERGQLAAAVYRDIETFAATVDQLGQAEIGQPTTAERAALAAAVALHGDASRALNKQLEKQPADAPPPEAVSAEFASAIAAYQAVIAKYPNGPLVKTAISQTLAIGLQYAQTGAWDVADSVYEGFLAQKLPLRHPERIEFARAMCQVGKVKPDHAEKVLSEISQDGRSSRDDKDGNDSAQIASVVVDDLFGGARRDRFRSLADAFGVTPDAGANSTPAENPIGEVASATKPGDDGKPAPAADASDQPTDPAAAAPPVAEPPPAQPSAEELANAEREAQLLAAVQQQQGNRAERIARMRDATIQIQHAQEQNESQIQLTSAVLSEAELARQTRLLDAAYALLQALRTRYPTTPTTEQARGEIAVIVNHWRGLSKWERSAQLAARFLADNPTDRELPKIRQEIARDYLAWAAQGVEKNGSKQTMLDTVISRFEQARTELASIVTDFPDDDVLRHHAQWDIANSFLTQARVVATLSPTLARGQFVRSANELMQVAERYHDHPQIGTIPQMLANIANELAGRSYHDEAISVWNLLSINYPMHQQGQQAALRIAQTYQSQNQSLRAVEAYVELNFARGGNDQSMQNAIYQIATTLMSQKRWVEALHVLETFVDSFPQHPQAGQALTMIGQIHQTNEVWEDAIAAYDRVITEYAHCQWVKQARWSIAECTINLSRWRDAIDNYRKFASAYAEDPQAAIATQRVEILKDLDRYQNVVDEEGQRKAFDAQFQIAEIVREKLSNRVKSIIEYRKVVTKWPESHLADDALYQAGVTYLALGETEKAREVLLAAAEKYPGSPLADDALFMVGQSYENEAQRFAAVTRDTSAAIANDAAQKEGYKRSQARRYYNIGRGAAIVSQLKREGKFDEADNQVAVNAATNKAFDYANAQVIAKWASQEAETLTAAQLADRQDKVNAALRKAVASFRRASSLVSGDRADDALLRMAQIYDQRLKDADAAMETWLEIVKQFSGTSVAEDASWKIAQYHEQHIEYAKAIESYQAFLRNYRNSARAGSAQAAIAENYEHLGKWVEAMDAYTNYLNKFPKGPRIRQAKQQISWIKTYRL
jgi:TolA-binding protein